MNKVISGGGKTQQQAISEDTTDRHTKKSQKSLKSQNLKPKNRKKRKD